MASTAGAAAGASSTAPRSQSGVSDGVEIMARAGYTAKGVVYALIGVLAAQQAIGRGGSTSGTREALQNVVDARWGTILLAAITVGLAGYVAWRLVQAFLDPEGKRSDRGDVTRWLVRAFHLMSAGMYGLLAYYGATLVLGSNTGGAGGASGTSDAGWISALMQMSWGVWIVGGVGLAIVARGLVQFVKAYTQSFREKISTYELDAAKERWAITASRVGLTARGVIFGLIGGSIIQAAVTHDPQRAQGLEGALDILSTSPWLLGAVGVGLMAYAVYQWVKARYRLIGA